MTKLIKITDLTYCIPYSYSILENINLEASEGDFIGILGQNGAGKTTLMDLLMGMRKPSIGEVKVLDEEAFGSKRDNLKYISFLSHDITLKGNSSVAEFLSFHSEFYPSYSKKYEQELLKLFSVSQDKKIGSLSTGETKKVQIIAALASLPQVILIDEITAVLDPSTRHAFFNAIEDYRKKHPCAVLLATNIAEDLVTRANKIFFIQNKKGEIHQPDSIAKLFSIPNKEVA